MAAERWTATLGIDLASRATNTALCVIEWKAGAARVIALWKGVNADGSRALDDELLASAMRGSVPGLPEPSKIAIDAPLGWPVDFVRGLRHPEKWPVSLKGDRSRLERRATDHWVHEAAAKQPLSVTTDRIAYAAMRAAGLLAHYERGVRHPIDRTGVTGPICETYPDPAIRRLGLWPSDARQRESYKGTAAPLRGRIVGALVEAAPWLELSSHHRAACAASDDCLDALTCALVARVAERGFTEAPPTELSQEARSEGWIHLPKSPEVLTQLV